MQYVYNVHCMMCGRASGYVRGGVFQRLPSAPPLVQRAGRCRCGFCGGNVYLEAEDSPVVPAAITSIAERRAMRAS